MHVDTNTYAAGKFLVFFFFLLLSFIHFIPMVICFIVSNGNESFISSNYFFHVLSSFISSISFNLHTIFHWKCYQDAVIFMKLICVFCHLRFDVTVNAIIQIHRNQIPNVSKKLRAEVKPRNKFIYKKKKFEILGSLTYC